VMPPTPPAAPSSMPTSTKRTSGLSRCDTYVSNVCYSVKV
jgi:hypothetical protein